MIGSFLLGLVLGANLILVLGSIGRRSSNGNADFDWRRSFSHENTNSPVGDPPHKFWQRTQGVCLDPGRVQQGNGKDAFGTAKPVIKPQFPDSRIIGPGP